MPLNEYPLFRFSFRFINQSLHQCRNYLFSMSFNIAKRLMIS